MNKLREEIEFTESFSIALETVHILWQPHHRVLTDFAKVRDFQVSVLGS